MIASVRAVSPEDFEAWLEGKRREIEQSNDAAARQREEIEGTQQEAPGDPSSEQAAPDASPSTGG
jgi:hypothetical protein